MARINLKGMQQDMAQSAAFVVKAGDITALNYLAPSHPQPRKVEWINRGTNQILKPSTVDMLLRTLFQDVASPSVVSLHRSAGLRAIFRTDSERDRFASAFAAAKDRVMVRAQHLVTAIFSDRKYAEQTVSDLKSAGIPDSAISLLWRASQFLDTDIKWPEGHSKLSVANATAGGAVAGAILGVAILTIPGVGPVAVAGAIASSAFSSVAAVSGIIGSTGAAISRMLTDHDVDGVSANYYAQQIRQGRIFVSVDMNIAEGKREVVRQIVQQNGGRTATRA